VIEKQQLLLHTIIKDKNNSTTFAFSCVVNLQQEILLDRDQSNVFHAHIIFSYIFLSAYSFLSACIRDPASIWDTPLNYHGLCDSNKLLYRPKLKLRAKSMGKPKIRPPLLPHFEPILLKLKTKKNIGDTTLHAKVGW